MASLANPRRAPGDVAGLVHCTGTCQSGPSVWCVTTLKKPPYTAST